MRSGVSGWRAGLRGAGEAISDEEVARLSVDGGAPGYVRIAGSLLAATFGVEESPFAEAAPVPT